jgi:hypothetical protein
VQSLVVVVLRVRVSGRQLARCLLRLATLLACLLSLRQQGERSCEPMMAICNNLGVA